MLRHDLTQEMRAMRAIASLPAAEARAHRLVTQLRSSR